MTEASWTKITPSEVVYSPEYETTGTLYPAVNEKHDGLTPVMSKFNII